MKNIVNGFLGPKSILAFLALGTGLCYGSSISFSTTGTAGNLLGTQTLPQFNSALGTLTGVTFQLLSNVTGPITMVGTLTETVNGVTCTTPPGATTNVSVAGFNGNLNNSINVNFPGIVVSPANNCIGSSPYTQAVNMGPSGAQPPLNGYIGAGTMPFSFTSTGITNPVWTGTLSVTYDFVSANPEPSTSVLMFSGIVAIVAFRRRRQAGK